VISLPNDKIFSIGGSFDEKGNHTKKDTIEYVKDPETGERQAVVRAAFGIAVYPNFS